MTETTILVIGPVLNPKSANTVIDTVTNTETTFQRKNLVTNCMGYFFHHRRAPKAKFATKILTIFRLFLKICVQFQALEIYIPPRSGKSSEKFEEN